MKWNLHITVLTTLFFLSISTILPCDAQAKLSEKSQNILKLPQKPISPIKQVSVSEKKTLPQRQSKKYSAKKSSQKSSKKIAGKRPDRFAALVVNANTGRVLYERNAGAIRYPASLTKMMTLYLAFDALKKDKLDMDGSLPVSEKAASQPQTNISLNEGDRLPVKTAIESVIVRSANDSAMVLAEALGGDASGFAQMMTKKARALGMKDTVFRNPNGLPDDEQHTTAYDMAKLGIALRRDFPEYYPMFKLKSFAHNGITYPGHNRVMNRYEGVDGIKTGYIRASGFNLVTSVRKDGYNLVAVIMGGTSAAARDNEMIDMLDKTFSKLESGQKTFSKNQTVEEKQTASLAK